MPTIIDSLMVVLGLNASGFNQGMAGVNARLGQTGAAADRTGKKLENVAGAAAKFLAVIGGTVAIKAFISNTIQASAALDTLAKNLGDSAQNISAWSRAVEQAGGTAAGLQATMSSLSAAQTELQLTGQSGLIPYFSMLGVAMADASGKARPVGEILLDLSDRFARMDRPTAVNVARMMGIDEGTILLLLRGRNAVQEVLDTQKQYGAVTNKQAEDSRRIQAAMVVSRQSFEAFGRTLLASALPGIEGVAKVFGRVGDWISENQEFVQAFISTLAVGLGALAAVTVPVSGLVVAIVGLGAAIAALYQDYQTFKRGGDSLINWANWEKEINFAAKGFKLLKSLAIDFIKTAWDAARIQVALFSGDFSGAYDIGKSIAKRYGRYLDGGDTGADTGVAMGAEMAPSGAASRQEETVKYFQSQGWTREQAIGIAANLQRESSFNPSAVGDGGNAYGLAQWHPDRQAQFQAAFGKPIQGSTFQEQLAFVQYELTQGQEKPAGERLRGATSAEEAAALVSRLYERPADEAGEAAKRAQMAALMAGIPGAGMAAMGAGAVSAAQMGNGAIAAPSQTTVETNINEIKVYTQATDANGMARDMGKAMDYLFTSQANGGLN